MSSRSPPSTTSLGFGIKAKSTDPSDAEPKAKILLVDDDPASRRFMNARLATANYLVESAEGPQAALDYCVRSRPNLVIADLHLKHMDGLALLQELKSRWPTIMVIIVTAYGTIAEAVQATQRGAFGFLVKPVEKTELLGQVARAIAASTYPLAHGDWRAGIVARSRLMEDRLESANLAAGSEAPVLLTGENGTGKELLARAIHAASARRDHPFVAVRCGDQEPEAVRSALFGDDLPEGTEDSRRSGGAVSAARNGTLLLDEIGCLPDALQMELIRTLQPSETGSARSQPGARLISTTSTDLKKLMESGGFRQDLYYHVNVLPIAIPPLGRRREDIPLLVSHFLEQATEAGDRKKIYSPAAIELLATTDWPGNVGQLFDLVRKNVALSHGPIIGKEVVEDSLGGASRNVPSYDEAREIFARDYLASNLRATAGNVTESARIAKRNRTDFYKLLARYRLQPESFKRSVGRRAKKDKG